MHCLRIIYAFAMQTHKIVICECKQKKYAIAMRTHNERKATAYFLIMLLHIKIFEYSRYCYNK